MTFWIITTVMALVIATMLGLVLLRTRPAVEPAAAYDLRVYRDQLKDVDRDVARGVIGEADADRIRTEISRRILATDAQIRAAQGRQGQSTRLSLIAALLLAALTTAGSLWLYRGLGAPGYGDLGLADRIAFAEELRADRPDQATAEASLPPAAPPEGLTDEYLGLLKQLRETAANRPDDLQGQALLARHEAAIGDFAAAYRAQAQVLRLKGDAASADDYGTYVDLMVMAAGGYVSPEAEAALRQVLTRDPANGPGRYYWGLMMSQTGRPDVAFRVWESLLRDSPPDARWVPPVRAQIEQMAQRAGVDFVLPEAEAATPGPSAADVAAAGDMDAADRTEMIRGMVQRLSDRLATEGGTPAEWARLINALGVLGETERARAIHANGRQVFAGDADALEQIDGAARQAGALQ